MLIRIPAAWEISSRLTTPESAYRRRRDFLLAAGLIPVLSAAPNRNPQFQMDRALTPEWAATSYNNYFEFTTDKMRVKDLVKAFVPRPWSVEVSGFCQKPKVWDFDELERRMPIEERLYRHRCVEAWAMAVPWMGFPLAKLLAESEPSTNARFVRFLSVNRPEQMPGIRYSGSYEWPYHEALRLDEAMNPLAFLVTGLYGKPLPAQNGAPLRLALPWKYGFKGPKAIVKIEFLAEQPKTFWNTYAPAEYGFYANVNPARPHPRWSQAVEQMIPNMRRVRTLPYNGYGEFVGRMYKGQEI